MHWILHFAALAGTILLLTRFLPGVRVKSVTTALVVALVFSLINLVAGPVIKVLLFLPGLLTLGLLFLVLPLIVNTIVLWLTDKLIKSFEIQDARALWLSSGAITLMNFVFSQLFR